MAWLSLEKSTRLVTPYSHHLMLRLQLALLTAYIFAQMMGGVVGAALVYANYFHAIDIFEGGRGIRTLKTAGLFSTYAVSTTIVLLLGWDFHRYSLSWVT